ncbi:MAG: DUF3750 domain-containing protein [Beijerinckiaceae bacterium]|nr:DUF3750 domain-containing protein [Beijerinckiaceae bacterium]
MSFVQKFSLAFLIFFAMPLAVRAAVDWRQSMAETWSSADWSSTGQLPRPTADSPAMVRVYAARTGRWRGIFAVHTWIVIKEKGAARYERFDKVGWGRPIRNDAFPPDARWFGHDPEIVFAADGPEAQALLPKMRAAIAAYAFANQGDYRAWPGPNSNTFVASVLAAVPEIGVAMPALALGKDFPVDGAWVGWAPSRTGFRVTLGGYAGLTIGRVEGLEINLLGAVAGLDIRRPAVKLPGFGRIGMSAPGDPSASPAV